jgi:hypothetical protein
VGDALKRPAVNLRRCVFAVAAAQEVGGRVLTGDPEFAAVECVVGGGVVNSPIRLCCGKCRGNAPK